MLKKPLSFSHDIIMSTVSKGDYVIDATLGNGHDTLFLADLVGETGRVFGFDIQKAAIESTKERLAKDELLEQVKLIHDGHENMASYIPEEKRISAVMFNLGYLPKGDKHIVTTSKTTIQAIESLFDMLASEGIIVLVIYPGHPEGQIESNAVFNYLQQFNQQKAHVLQYGFINQQNNPPYICAIEKR